ncbi:MAG: AAA domain-containing protein [Planctomycetaceae bacterium]
MENVVSDQERIAKERIAQIFQFLKALNEHRSPAIRQVREQPWMMWLDFLPNHPSIVFPERVARPSTANDDESTAEPDFILRVRRPKLTSAPSLPAEVSDWLQPGWDDPHKDVIRLESRNEYDSEGEVITVRFDDDPGRTDALERWLKNREAWRTAELPARDAMAVFDKLYGLHGRLEREAERVDLVIGDGVLSWEQQQGSIYHPILLQRVQLIFDPHVPEFTIVDADFSSELYTSLFHSVSDSDPQTLRAVAQELDKGGYHPLDVEVGGFLEGLVNRLSPARGTFVGRGRPEPSSEHPTIGRAPVLLLRSRTKGFGNAIEQVIEAVADRSDFCDALKNIVGCESLSSPDFRVESDERPPGPERPARDILFGKPANQEQLRIAQAIDRHGSVLVQGPPGTGKSHTIANLIGHLLAHGQSVLVTSHTTKALRVLRNHLVEELRPLCVSVLESDLDSRQQLEDAVQAISARLSNSDVQELEREAGWLDEQRSRLLEELVKLQEDLKNARADEYREIVIGGKGIPPSDAARLVSQGRGQHDWIPSSVAFGEPCPLSASEVRELYATNELTRPNDDRLVERPLPSAAELPLPDDIARSFLGMEDIDAGRAVRPALLARGRIHGRSHYET